MLEFFRFGESNGDSEFVEHSRTHYPMDMDNSSGKAKGGEGQGGKWRRKGDTAVMSAF